MLLQDFYMFWNHFLLLIMAVASLSCIECANIYIIHKTRDIWPSIVVNDFLRTDMLPRILINRMLPMLRLLECLRYVHDLLNY